MQPQVSELGATATRPPNRIDDTAYEGLNAVKLFYLIHFLSEHNITDDSGTIGDSSLNLFSAILFKVRKYRKKYLFNVKITSEAREKISNEQVRI